MGGLGWGWEEGERAGQGPRAAQVVTGVCGGGAAYVCGRVGAAYVCGRVGAAYVCGREGAAYVICVWEGRGCAGMRVCMREAGGGCAGRICVGGPYCPPCLHVLCVGPSVPPPPAFSFVGGGLTAPPHPPLSLNPMLLPAGRSPASASLASFQSPR